MQLKYVLEAALMCADEPMDIHRLKQLFSEEEGRPSNQEIRDAILQLQQDYHDRAIEVCEVASGFCLRVKQDYSAWIQKLYQEKPPRYSRALLETLALIAYKQPITRAEIEEVRGVSVGGHILKTLIERNWVAVVGQKEVPGRPALYATTKVFLDYFNLRSLEDLPPLEKVQDLEQLEKDLQKQLQLDIHLETAST